MSEQHQVSAPIPVGTPRPAEEPMIEDIIRYEQRELDEGETIRLFQYLVDTGLAWRLQGHYGRIAKTMLEEGTIL